MTQKCSLSMIKIDHKNVSVAATDLIEYKKTDYANEMYLIWKFNT